MLGQGAPTSLSLGQLGGRYVTAATGAVTGDFGVLHAIAETIFTSITSSTIPDDLSGLHMFGGDTIFGRFSAFQVQSGAVIAYNITRS